MSFFMRMGITITDLECFKRSCEKNGVTYELNQDDNFMMQGSPVHAVLKDSQTGRTYANQWYLVRDKGAFKVVADNDVNYNSLAGRIGGRDRNQLLRDYARNVVEEGVRKSGGMVNYAEERPDGSIILRVSNL